MYGYFYVKTYNNPYIEHMNIYNIIKRTKAYLNENYDFDWILYDYVKKPSKLNFDSFIDMLLWYINANDTLVVLSLFQLGNTKVQIYKTLEIMRTKQVRLIVKKWEVDISSTMKKVTELSEDDIAIYENLQLYRNHCSDYTVEDNLYRKLVGYKLNEKYVSNETIRRKV